MRKAVITSGLVLFSNIAIASSDMTSALDIAYCVGVSQVHLETNMAILNLNNISLNAKRETELHIRKIKSEMERRIIVLNAYLSSAPNHRSSLLSMIEQGDKDQRMCLGAFSDTCTTDNRREFYRCGNETFEKFCPVKTRQC